MLNDLNPNKRVGITSEGVHWWHAMNPWHKGIHLADVPSHGLKEFQTKDDLINWLFLKGFKASAREINKTN